MTLISPQLVHQPSKNLKLPISQTLLDVDGRLIYVGDALRMVRKVCVRPDVKRTSMKRFFSKKEKRHLAILAGGDCMHCGSMLSDSFHGDHVVPFSKGGATHLANGQALCPKCNLEKGAKHEQNPNSARLAAASLR